MVYVTNNMDNSVSIFNATSNKMLPAVMTGLNPDDIAVNPLTSMVYVTNRESNSLSIINGTSNEVINKVKISVNPPNSGYVTCNGKLIGFEKELVFQMGKIVVKRYLIVDIYLIFGVRIVLILLLREF